MTMKIHMRQLTAMRRRYSGRTLSFWAGVPPAQCNFQSPQYGIGYSRFTSNLWNAAFERVDYENAGLFTDDVFDNDETSGLF